MVAQQITGMSGTVVDAQTGETLPFVQIYFVQSDGKPTTVGTTSDMDGKFSISSAEGYTQLQFQMMSYKVQSISLRPGQYKRSQIIKLEPDAVMLGDIIVKPVNKHKGYRRKGNPAVELVKNVIAHKDSGNVKTVDHYTATSYSRMTLALDNFHPDFQKRFWRSFAFAEKYIDTTGVYDALTVSLREHITSEYYQRRPHKEHKVIDTKRIFGIEDLADSQAFRANINAIFKDVDIYDDNMSLLFNRFVSPLSSSLAVSYYQYYIQDTLVMDGDTVIDLAFVPVNSESYSFTGHMYILNDGSYKLKHYAMNIPAEINMNFVSGYTIEHNYVQLENGLWAPDRTTTQAQFYLIKNKQTLRARQTRLYTNWDLESPIDKEVFASVRANYEEQALSDSSAIRLGARAWDTLRPEPLTFYETSVYDLVHEVTGTPKFASLLAFVNAATSEFIALERARRLDDAKWMMGPIYNFVSWNALEGVRLRVGVTTTAKLHPQFYFRGYAAYGFADQRPKYNATFTYSFEKKKKHPYQGFRHYLEAYAQYDVEVPGQLTDVIRRDHILMSIPLSKPTVGYNQYVFHANLSYTKEWENMLMMRTAFDFSNNEAAGALHYDRIRSYTEDGRIGEMDRIRDYRCYDGAIELRYSPGKMIYMDRMGIESPFVMDKDAPTFRLSHHIGYLDDRHSGGTGFFYNNTSFSAEKRFWFSSFGHLDTRLEAGYNWQRTPFTKLYVPQTSTSIFLAQRGFNMMKPMEFLTDEYVAWYMTYYFKGWILNRIPGINKLKLRGVVSFNGIYGGLSKKNNPFLATGENLYMFPQMAIYDENGYFVSGQTCSPIGKLPYMELTAGFENILKFIRIDYIRRLTYNDYELPDGHRRKMGIWGRNGIKLTVRFAL